METKQAQFFRGKSFRDLLVLCIMLKAEKSCVVATEDPKKYKEQFEKVTETKLKLVKRKDGNNLYNASFEEKSKI
jgi:ABC-type thiamine transport system substrate-binding protein